MRAAAGRWRRAGRAGMTLVEVVVALAVLSLVVLALGASLRGLSMSAQRVDERVAAIDEMRVTIAFLRELMARVVPARPAVAGARPMFDAQADNLTWVALMPPRFGASGRFVFRLALERDGDAEGRQSLVLRYAPWNADAAAPPDWSRAEGRRLVARAQRLVLGYGGTGLAQGWRPAWPQGADAEGGAPGRLPAHVRIDLATARGPWPPVVLPLRTPATAGPTFTIGGGTP